jgi:hypothetical protein
MGAWGVGIFDDDVACADRIALYDVFRNGQSANEATDAVLQDLSDLNCGGPPRQSAQPGHRPPLRA